MTFLIPEVLKGVGGATSLINRTNDSVLNRWLLCGPELSCLLTDFEESHLYDGAEQETAKHHKGNLNF